MGVLHFHLSRAAHPCELQVGVDPGDQLSRRKRLDEVVVGAGFDALDPRLLAGAGRQEHDGDTRGRRIPPQGAKQSEAVEARHHDVREHQIRPARPRRVQGRVAVSYRFHGPVLTEQPSQVVPHVGVVVRQKDARV